MKIGWIGTGVMGNAMCGHLIEAGHTLAVNTRTKSKAENLIEKGACWKDTPAEAAAGAEAVFSIVGYPEDVRQVYLSENGILAGACEEAIAVDMTTSSPELADEIFKAGKEKGISCLDAPVSGGDVGAKNASLSIMIGGEKKTFEKILPVLELMGKNINYMGPAGSGQHTKMANQIHIAATMISAVESLIYACRAGLNPQEVINAIGSGAAGTWTINNLGQRIIKRNFDPGFYVEHFIKDMGIALKEAERMNLCLPGLSLAHQFYLSAKALGLEKNGTQALALVFEKMNNTEIKQTLQGGNFPR